MTPQEQEVVRAMDMGAEGSLQGLTQEQKQNKLVHIKAIDLQTLVRLAKKSVPDSPVA